LRSELRAWQTAHTPEADNPVVNSFPQVSSDLEGHTRDILSAMFSSDGQRIVTTGEDNTARVWNAASGRLLATLQGHTDAVVSAEFSPDGQRIVTASGDRTPRVWNADDSEVRSWTGPQSTSCQSESPDALHI